MAMSKQELSNKAGIPIFPGAALPEGKNSVTPAATETRYSLVMETTATVSEIVNFYTGKIPGLSATKTATSGDLIGQTAQGSLAHIKISTQAGKRLIEAVAIVETPAKTSARK